MHDAVHLTASDVFRDHKLPVTLKANFLLPIYFRRRGEAKLGKKAQARKKKKLARTESGWDLGW